MKEMRVTIELLDEFGNVIEEREVLSEVTADGVEPGFSGDVATEIDELIRLVGAEDDE